LCDLPAKFQDSSFEQGRILSFEEKLFDSSAMDAFLVSPFIMSEPPMDSVQLPYASINISQLVPIYLEEAKAVQRIGLGAFIEELGQGLYDMERPRIRLG
jgi:hypothetical protein